MTGRYRIRAGETIGGTVIASVVSDVTALFRVVYDNGQTDDMKATLTTVSTRALELIASRDVAKFNGYVVDGIVLASGSPKRGQLYVQFLVMSDPNQTATASSMLIQGYAYGGHAPQLGENVEPGPGGGEGFLSWLALATEVAGNVDTTAILAATNAYRKVYGFLVKYDAAAVVATRTILIALQSVGVGVPTGFTLATDVWRTATVTLTTGEEATIYVNGEADFVSYNDTTSGGTQAITYASTDTNPRPFPLHVTEAELAQLFVDITLGEATDVYSVWALIEEWLVL